MRDKRGSLVMLIDLKTALEEIRRQVISPRADAAERVSVNLGDVSSWSKIPEAGVSVVVGKDQADLLTLVVRRIGRGGLPKQSYRYARNWARWRVIRS